MITLEKIRPPKSAEKNEQPANSSYQRGAIAPIYGAPLINSISFSSKKEGFKRDIAYCEAAQWLNDAAGLVLKISFPYDEEMKTLSIFFTLLFSLTALGETRVLFTLHRENLKPWKTLHYALHFDPTSCEMASEDPFEIYYVDNETGERIEELSSDSREWFQPHSVSEKATPFWYPFTFKALQKLEESQDTRIPLVARTVNVGDGCEAFVETELDHETLVVQHVELKFKKIFGIPGGLKWARLDSVDSAGVHNSHCLTDAACH